MYIICRKKVIEMSRCSSSLTGGRHNFSWTTQKSDWNDSTLLLLFPHWCVNECQWIAFMARYGDMKNNLISQSHLTPVSTVLYQHDCAFSYCANVVFLNKAILSQSFLVLEIKFASTSATIIVIMLFLICANRNTQLQMLWWSRAFA